MRVKVSEIRGAYQITCIETFAEFLRSAAVCSIAYSGYKKEDSYYCPFVKTINRYPMDSHADNADNHSGPTEVVDCSLPPPNMAATKTGEQGNAWFSVL